MDNVHFYLLTNKTGILIKDRINVYDEVYVAWRNEEINLYEYLNYYNTILYMAREEAVIENMQDGQMS